MMNNWIGMEKHGSKWKKVISFSGRCPITLHRTLPRDYSSAYILWHVKVVNEGRKKYTKKAEIMFDP